MNEVQWRQAFFMTTKSTNDKTPDRNYASEERDDQLPFQPQAFCFRPMKQISAAYFQSWGTGYHKECKKNIIKKKYVYIHTYIFIYIYIHIHTVWQEATLLLQVKLGDKCCENALSRRFVSHVTPLYWHRLMMTVHDTLCEKAWLWQLLVSLPLS